MFDWILKNANIIDGSGKDAYTADIGITGEKIAAVERGLKGQAVRVLDIKGLTAAPGFIDIHRHADAALFRPGFGEMELRQGITSIVNGNCGLSAAPCPDSRRDEISARLTPVLGSLSADAAVATFSDYVASLKKTRLPLNVGMLVGSGTMRAAVCGYSPGGLEPHELRHIHSLLNDAIGAGALGVSAGLSYPPDIYYTADELSKALLPIRGLGLPFVCHVRGEGDLLYDSVNEAAHIARILDAPLEISHLKCIGRRNWTTLLKKTIGLVESLRSEGQDITCDVYPWTAGSTQLSCLLPPELLQGGAEEVIARLRDPKQRELCRLRMSGQTGDFENIADSVGWDAIYVSGVKTRRNMWCVGKNIGEIAAGLGTDPYSALFELLADEECDVTMVDYIACEEDIETILRLPYSSVISDTVYPDAGRPHPRGYGNTVRLLTQYTGMDRPLTLEQAVRKLTGLPAQALRLHSKGLLRPGYDADIVVFDKGRISCKADYQNPERFPVGFELVLVNGEAAVERDTLTGKFNGRYICR